MVRFIGVVVCSVVLVCFFMQKPLAVYLEQTYNKNFGLKFVADNQISSTAMAFYDYLKFSSKKVEFQEVNVASSKDFEEQDQATDQNTSLPSSVVSDLQIKEDEEISSDLNQSVVKEDTENLALKPENLKSEKEILTPSQKLDKNTDEIRLSSGDEVLFIGDSLMQNIAKVCYKMFSKHGVQIIDKSKHSTGLANKKYHNWESVLKQSLKENDKIKLVVVLLGGNDFWGFSIEGKYREFGTPKWNELYKRRVDEILSVAKDSGVRVLWLGLPCMKKSDFDEKMSSLNEIFIEKNAEFNQKFLDTKQMICSNAKYATYIQKDGDKSLKVRADDGIHINISGSKIIAKYILKEIKFDENTTK